MPATAVDNLSSGFESDLSVEPKASISNLSTELWQSRPRGDKRLESINIRRAARINAAHINENEFEKLLTERHALLRMKFDEGLDKSQERRLAFVRWSLDRIQDARHGAALDELESAVAQYEMIGDEINALIKSLDSYQQGRSRR